MWNKIAENSWWGFWNYSDSNWGDVYQGFPIGQEFEDRVVADGGTVDGLICSMNAINEL